MTLTPQPSLLPVQLHVTHILDVSEYFSICFRLSVATSVYSYVPSVRGGHLDMQPSHQKPTDICQFVASQLNGLLVLSLASLSPLDCLSVGYFLSCVCATTSCSGEFRVQHLRCSIDDDCCRFLMRGLSRCPTPNTTVTGQLNMYLWHY